MIIETAALNEADLAEYCRRKGLYPEQIAQWCEAAAAGTDAERPLTREERQAWQAEKKRSRKLERELTRQEEALAEAAALLVLAKRRRPPGGSRGRLTDSADRQAALEWLTQAQASGARLAPACAVLGFDIRTYQRWRQAETGEDKREAAAAERVPANKLSETERAAILRCCNSDEHQSLPPSQIVPRLAGQG